MKFLLDACAASRTLHEALIDLGHDVLSAREGYSHATDETLLAPAFEECRVLVTQFGGGKTHTLTALYHLANTGAEAVRVAGVSDLLTEAGGRKAADTRVGVFGGNAWESAPQKAMRLE